MRKTAATFSWVLFGVLAFVSLISAAFMSSSAPLLSYYAALMLPGLFLILGITFSIPLSRSRTIQVCAAGGVLYIPVLVDVMNHGRDFPGGPLTLVTVLVLVPGLIAFMGVE